jgi:hypothetical protein
LWSEKLINSYLVKFKKYWEDIMEKLDLKKKFKRFYEPSAKKVEIIEVPSFKFAMLNGKIEPGQGPSTSPVFQEAVSAMYGISFTLKFASKLRKVDPLDYTVMALEGLWWGDTEVFDVNDPQKAWNFTLMMMQPDHITLEMFQTALSQLHKKKDSPALARLRLESFQEGLCVQTMHIGPYAGEPHTLSAMKAFASQAGYRLCGKHHEIYLGDPRKAPPDKLKTVLRYPIEKALPPGTIF